MRTHEDETVENPYREAFYGRQAEWHGYRTADDARSMHEKRLKYYRWFTKDWLPASPAARALDIGCGCGQFLYFLRERGYRDATGIDLDRDQVGLARQLGLKAARADAIEYLGECDGNFGLITMLDILEHFRRDELFPLLEAVSSRLDPGGRLIASVPNADSPHATRAVYADITHEIAFTPTSLSELFFCHGLRVVAFRDPWPAPVSPLKAAYRGFSAAMRGLEAVRLRMLGFDAPKHWSSVIWVLVEKPADDPRADREGRP